MKTQLQLNVYTQACNAMSTIVFKFSLSLQLTVGLGSSCRTEWYSEVKTNIHACNAMSHVYIHVVFSNLQVHSGAQHTSRTHEALLHTIVGWAIRVSYKGGHPPPPTHAKKIELIIANFQFFGTRPRSNLNFLGRRGGGGVTPREHDSTC